MKCEMSAQSYGDPTGPATLHDKPSADREHQEGGNVDGEPSGIGEVDAEMLGREVCGADAEEALVDEVDQVDRWEEPHPG